VASWKDRMQRLRPRTGSDTVEGMSPSARQESGSAAKHAPAPTTPTYHVDRPAISVDRHEYEKLKARLRHKVLDMVDLSVLKEMQEKEVEKHIGKVAADMLDKSNVRFNARERAQCIKEVVDDVVGFGPLEPLLHDPAVSDILVNGARQVYVELGGKLQLTDVEFHSNTHLRQVIDRIVSKVGRHIDESSPMCDARLPDGSRVNAIIPPLAIDYPALSIRKFKADMLSVLDLVRAGAFTEEMGQVFQAAVRCRLNILISGGTGAGKTTLLNLLSGFIPHDERIVTIEDSAELQLQQPHVVRLETRPPNIEGKGDVTQYDLLRNSLRMRPDRIIIGEVRGREALDMLQAMNTGHDGSMSTVHANSPRDALTRLETMIAMSGVELPPSAMRQQVASALDIIVQQQRLPDGSRKVTTFSEVIGMEGDMITMQDIFVFERAGRDKDGKVRGRHVSTGVQPRFVEKMKTAGIDLPVGLFLPDR